MTVAAGVVRWGVLVVVWAATVQATGVVDISRCRNGCSSVPEDLWPSCCESHNTCCTEFADSCMHDCLPRVHTGDVSVVEERPGMCCALYNLCCFRETFRISSSKSNKQVPASFPIVHRFQVHSPSVEEAIRIPGSRPPPRPSFQDSARRPSKFKKLPGDDADIADESKKPRSRPKFPSLLERRKFDDEEFKVTRRPAGSDIRQEIVAPEVAEAEPMGARRLDASINPVVTRKRLLVNSESRREPRVTSRKEKPEPEERGPRGRMLQNTPAREGRKLSAGRSSSRPAAPQQGSSRAQAAVVAGQGNSRPNTRRPVQAPATHPVQGDTPKITVGKKPSAAQAAVEVPKSLKDSEHPPAQEEANDPIESIITALQDAHNTPEAITSTLPELSPLIEENVAGEASDPEVAMEKAVESPSEPVEKTEVETDIVTADQVKTPANTAFIPPEIEVNTPKVTIPRVAESTATSTKPLGKPQATASVSRPSTGTSRGQTQTRSGEQTQVRARGSSRSQTAERTARLDTSQKLGKQRFLSRESPTTEAPSTQRPSRTRG